MEDYIYILGGIAYVAYMIYSSMVKQKKQEELKRQAKLKAEAQADAEEEHEFYHEKSDTHEEITTVIDDLLGFPNFQEEIEEDLYQEFNYSSKPLDSIPAEEGEATTIQKEIHPKDRKYESIIIPEDDDILIEDELEDKEETSFNLRDAVIASEILNPKYIKN